MQSLGRAPAKYKSVPRSPAPRRDPAPSRWQYRMQRLWLTPIFRRLCRVGLPVAVVGLIALAVFASAERREAVVQGFAALQTKFEQRPEFRVKLLSIEGASSDLADAVRQKLALRLPQSAFDLNLDSIRATAEGLDAVAGALVSVRSGGVLQIVLTEREPVAVWRRESGLDLIDATGHRVASLVARTDRADLPLVAGEGADAAMPEALAIFDAAQPIAPRLRGLLRMGERRWDVVLDRNQRILLPQDNPVAALERLLALDHAEKILDRDILTIDLRNNNRPALRLAPFALNEARKAQGLAPITTGNDL